MACASVRSVYLAVNGRVPVLPQAITFRRPGQDGPVEYVAPHEVLIFSGLSQILLGGSVLATLKMQLENVILTTVIATIWTICVGIAGFCGACYVTSHSSYPKVGCTKSHRTSVICFRVYVGMLLLEVVLSVATAIHGIYIYVTSPSRPIGVRVAWEPGMTNMAFGLVLGFFQSLIIMAVRRALCGYYRCCHKTAHNHTANVGNNQTMLPPTSSRTNCQVTRSEIIPVDPEVGFPPPSYSFIQLASLTRLPPADRCEQVPLLKPSKPASAARDLPPQLYAAVLPPSYSEATGFRRFLHR